MTDLARVKSWLFSSLLVAQRMDALETEGLAVRPATDPAALQRIIPLEDFSADIRRSAMKALPAYLAFFCLENAIRELVKERLAENHGADWWDSRVPTGVTGRVKGRLEGEGKARWHVSRGEHPINYTDFGDLKSLITNNWEDFADLLPDQNWVVSRLDELEASRNIIAHSNVLDDRELGRIRLYLDDWTRQVG